MRRYAGSKDRWRWPIEARYSHGVRCGALIFAGGQGDLDARGRVRHVGDLEAQVEAAVGNLASVLSELGGELDDLVELVAFYVARPGVREAQLLSTLRRALGPRPMPAVAAIPVPYLALPGMCVLIEGVAMRGPDGAKLSRRHAAPAGHWPWPEGAAFAQGVRCGEMILVSAQAALDASGAVEAPGDIVKQSERVMENLGAVLAEFGATLNDAVRFRIFYRGTGRTEDWEVAARVRARYFEEPGPCATGIPVPRFDPPELAIKMWLWAMRGEDGSRLPRAHVWPEGHWDWTFHLPYKHGLKCRDLIFVGGQVPIDSRGAALAARDNVAQTHIAMGYLSRVLQAFGLPLDAVVKLNGFYADEGSAPALTRNLAVRQQFFRAPGPVTTELALPFLALDDMNVEIEAIAAADGGAAGG